MGLSVLTLVGLFQITLLLVPFTPRANISVLLLISLCICFGLCHQDLQRAWKKFKLTLTWVWILPMLLILVFSWMFHNGGLHLLVGGSDQLQYCENAKQILEEMHTGSSRDVPVARQEYFVHEMNTRILPYTKGYRRGAELMLATITSISGLSYQAAFPVTVLNILLILGLVIGLIGQFFLRLSSFYVFLLQLIFINSFYFLLIHVQGSLAMTMGIPTGLATLAFLSRINPKSSWRILVLTAIMTAAYFSIYAEPALINILIPSIAVLFWYFLKNKAHFFIMFRNLGLVYFTVFLLAPFAVFAIFAHTIGNFTLLTAPYLNTIATATTPIPVIQKFLAGFSMQTWEVAGAVLGFMSYYNVGSFHLKMKFLFIDHPIVALIGFLLFSGCGMLGCLKTKNVLGRLLSIPLLSWMLMAFVTAHQQDDYRFARSLHYIMPFAMVGIVLLVSQYGRTHYKFNIRKSPVTFTRQIIGFFLARPQSGKSLVVWRQESIKILAISVLAIFIIMNMYTTIRTVRFIASHNNENDPILLHFDERNSDWKLLKKELQYSALRHAPVLISGFQETVRPFAISIIMRDQTHILAPSILSFWKLYDINAPTLQSIPISKDNKKMADIVYKYDPTHIFNVYRVLKPYKYMVFNAFRFSGQFLIHKASSESWARYNTRLLAGNLFVFQQRENIPWDKIEAKLVNNSEQAVVSLNNSYPIEWASTKDVFPSQIKRFPNICNVVYRYRYAVILPDTMVAPLKLDKQGSFRELFSSGQIHIQDKFTVPQVFTLNYEGDISDVKLRVGDKWYVGKRESLNDHVTLTAVVYPKDVFSLSLVVLNTVKIRSIALDPVSG